MRKAGLRSLVLSSFYRCAVEIILPFSISVWHASCTTAEKRALHRVVKTAQRVVRNSLPTMADIYTTMKRASCSMKHPTHFSLFIL